MGRKIEDVIKVVPTERQLKWQQLEFIGFIHFGINTFYNAEWGQGNEDISCFNPKRLDAEQWVRALKAAEMKGVILTCKHHDGFCLWPSQYTSHNIANTPYKDGKGDIVKEVADACIKYDMKFGVYLSPWDMTESSYGTGKGYNEFFVNQLTELLTQYGDIFEIWFDGANGEGPNGKTQEYDWLGYYQTIRQLQPNAVIAIMGPDVRWIGNEAGVVRNNEWSVVPEAYSDPSYTASHSQQADDKEFAQTYRHDDADLGSRSVIMNYPGKLIWYPAETDTSIRPEWFYHPEQDSQVKNSEELFNLYKKSVGGNSVLLLNVPPNKDGLISEVDAQELAGLGEKIRQLKINDKTFPIHCGKNILYKDDCQFKCVESNELIIEVEETQDIRYLIIQEDITKGQRVEKFLVEIVKRDGEVIKLFFGTIGYKKIIDLQKGIRVSSIRIIFENYRGKKIYLKRVSVS
ncbi:alpha-L-fucosidase [Globicatella sulfidifaciens]|uniref:alpha-L-fucosidase n=1 Tax=Globicatella sulfidifaciens TaxID=136093 RepID=A0A7X8GZU1_9LACT|nr:alpha-L-fucosidase [Globicatella sulfidifaciens]NLJ17907.1 alpha-L-fucosidase [Globicatella sulfidifaciens]